LSTKIFNYNFTNQIYNSNSTAAKIAKYTLIGIALVAIVETIKNIVLTSFRIIANYNNSNNEKAALKKVELLKQANPSDPPKPLKINKWKWVSSCFSAIGLSVCRWSGISDVKTAACCFKNHKWKAGAVHALTGVTKAIFIFGTLYAANKVLSGSASAPVPVKSGDACEVHPPRALKEEQSAIVDFGMSLFQDWTHFQVSKKLGL
jgi:hypothetical protein